MSDEGVERPDVVLILTDQERAAPPYEDAALRSWRESALAGRRWFDEHGVSFTRHYTGSLACVPSRPTLLTGQYPDVHGVTQTDGLGKDADDTAMRWLAPHSVPTLGNWFRAAGYDTYYEGKWHVSHADLHDPDTGEVLATNDDDGVVDPVAVQAYLDADPLGPFGFSGWVGPEPHGGLWSNCGHRRDPIHAERILAWLADRYRRRAAGDPDARRPFLLVASFVNPHDIVLFPGWLRRSPLDADPYGTPSIPAPPTADEDLRTKPAAQAAYRAAYPTGYAPIGDGVYDDHADEYRRLYHRLHADVDGPIDAVRGAVVAGSTSAVLVRTADHGELLGAHGGLHQKWFNLYDEATRVPFVMVRTGAAATAAARTVDTPTSHVDLVPTLLSAAGIDPDAHADELAARFAELHPLPGTDLMPIVDGAAPVARTVYLMTRDNILEGDTGASAVARSFGRRDDAPPEMRIHVPEDVAANFEAVVTVHDGRLWKLVRTHDDPATWTEPHVRHLTSTGPAGRRWRTTPLPDEWELYDLTADPIEAENRFGDPSLADVQSVLVDRLAAERARCCPPRHTPWPYRPRLERAV